jgi:hypothetical protein
MSASDYETLCVRIEQALAKTRRLVDELHKTMAATTTLLLRRQRTPRWPAKEAERSPVLLRLRPFTDVD